MTQDHEKMIERIYSEIVGDEFTDGLIPKVDKLSKKVDKHENYIKIGAGLFLVITSIFAFFEQIKGFFK
jgi:hypothetical protein